MSDFTPYWTGTYELKPNGFTYRRRLIFTQRVPLFDFNNDVRDPLTLWLSPTDFVRPFRHFDKFDFGSVPLLLQGFVSPLASPRGFILHDSCFEFHHVWRNGVIVPISYSDTNSLLYTGMRADGCDKFTAGKTYAAVSAGGWPTWKKDPISLENKLRLERALAAPDS